MVRFDIVSLFTKVTKREIMNLVGRHFEKDVLGLFHHVLTTTYFTFNGEFYGQTDGVAMGSPHGVTTQNILFFILTAVRTSKKEEWCLLGCYAVWLL
jgi:hypothetical protein